MQAVAHVEVAVVGGGIIGAACASELRRRRPDRSLGLIERSAIGGGATAAAAGLAGLLTKRPDLHIQLAAESIRLHEEWHALMPETAMERLATILVFETAHESAAAAPLVEQVRRYDPWVQRLSAAEVAAREPNLIGPCFGGALSRAGLRFDGAELAGQWTVRAVGDAPVPLAAGMPAHWHLTAEVSQLRPADGRWAVVTTAGELTADHVVVASALETVPLLRELGWHLPLRARRGQAARTRPLPGYLAGAVVAGSYLSAKFDPGPPPDPDETGPLGYSFSAIPDAQGRIWLGSTRRFSADDRLRSDERIRLLHGATRRLRGFDIEWVERETAGLRVWSPDGLPLIGRLPGPPNLYVAAGHEGDGIAMAPITGRIIADMIDGRTTPRLDVGLLRPDRFGRQWMPADAQTDTLSG